VLLIVGVALRELTSATTAVFVGLWIAGFFGLRTILYGGLVSPYIAVLDIALVFVVFKGDIGRT
jgi:hypothetical protein